MIHDDSVTVEEAARPREPLIPVPPTVVCPDDDSVEELCEHDIHDMEGLLEKVWPRRDRDHDDDHDHDRDHDREPMPRQFGRFSIVDELGRGGFGVVYLAEDPLLKRQVALKLPRIGILSGTESWRRFLRESQAASRLDHPHVIPLLEAGAIGPVGYIVSAYVPGPSLDQWLRHHGRAASARWSAQIVAALAGAMEHAHERGILHRDLKPANIVLFAPECAGDASNRRAWERGDAGPWVPRICDFGMAKLREAEGDETRSRIACGSPSYMAPEQAEARHDEIGPATDVYGLGAVLYQVLAGRPPFSGKNDLETLRQVVAEEPAAPRKLRPGLPRDLETICLKCLAKNPGQRYPRAADLAEDLARFLDGRPIRARPVAAWERGWRWARRHPSAAALALAAAAAVLVGLGGLLWHDASLGKVNKELRQTVIQAEDNAREARHQKSRVEAHERLLRRQLAGHQVFGAQQAMTARDYERALRMLDAAEPELGAPGHREFAWSLLRQSIRAHIEIWNGHTAAVSGIAAAPDGRLIASADVTGEVRLWDLNTGACRALVPENRAEIQHFAFSPDGRTIAVATRGSGAIAVWDVASGRLRGTTAESEIKTISALLFSADGGCLAAVGRELGKGGRPFECWDIRPPTPSFPRLTPDDAPTASLRPDARLLSLARLIDGSPAFTPGQLAELKRSWIERPARGIARTRDQSIGVIAYGDGTFDIYDLTSQWRMATGGIRAGASALVFYNEENLHHHTNQNQRAKIERLANRFGLEFSGDGRRPNEVVGPRLSDRAAAFSSDGRCLALWHEDAEKGLEIIDLTTNLVASTFDLGPLNNLNAMTFTADGSSLALGGTDGKVRLWHVRAVVDPMVLPGHTPKEAWSLAFSPDGQTLASAGDDHCIRLWGPKTGVERSVLRGHQSLVTSVAYSPDGKTIASASFDLTAPVALWDVATGTLKSVLRGHASRARCVSFGPDGRTLASSSEGGTVIIWDLDRLAPKAISTQKSGSSSNVISPDGRTLGSMDENHLVLTELAGGDSRRIDTGGSAVSAIAYSPDGSNLASGHVDGSIDSWDVVTGRQTRKYPGHSGFVNEMAFSPDGRTLASAGEDRTVRVWDLITGHELLCLADFKAPVFAVAFSPDGFTLAAADHTGAIKLWRTRP